MEDIKIILDVNTANAAQSVSEFVAATAEGIERAYTRAADRAQQKMDELNRRQQEHLAIIDQNKQKITELQNVKTTAANSAIAGIDQEIAKLTQLSQARQRDIDKLEAQKLKAEEKGLLSLGATDVEKKALEAVTSQRLIDIGALRDQTKAIESVRDTSTASHERISAGIDEIIRKQQQHTAVINAEKQQIDELTAKKQGASAFEQDQLDQQIGALQRLVQARQGEQYQLEAKKQVLLEEESMMSSASEAERAKIMAVTDARLAELNVTREKATVEAETRSTMLTGLNAAKQQVDDLTRRQRVNSDVIEQDKRRLEDLRSAREKASGDERKRLDQEIEGMRKAIATREIENHTLDIKKLKLEETMALATAEGDLEKAAITENTAGRMAEINALKDVAKAQSNVNEQMSDGDKGIQQYFGRFLGVGGVLLVLRTITQAFQTQREEIERIIAAGEKFRSQNISLDDKFKQFYNEAGLIEGPEQKAAQAAMMSVAKANNLESEVVASTAVALAPILPKYGITDPTSDKYKSFVGNAALWVNRGMDAKMVGNYLGTQLHSDSNLTPEQFNQQLGSLKQIAGSPSRANELMQVYQGDKLAMDTAGFNLEDVSKLYTQLGNKGVVPEEIPTAVSQYFRGLVRLKGMPREEKMNTAMAEMMNNNPELGQLLGQSASQGTELDLKQVSNVLSRLNPETQLAVATRLFGGPRALPAMKAGAGWQDVTLPQAPAVLTAPTNSDQVAKLQKEQAEFESSQKEPTDPTAAYFNEQLTQEQAYETRNPDSLPWYLRGGILAGTVGKPFAWDSANLKENAAINVYGRHLLRQARLLNDIDSGKTKATPQQRQAVFNSLNELRDRIDPANIVTGTRPVDSKELSDLVKGGQSTADVLSNIKSDDEFLKTVENRTGYIGDIATDKAASPILDRANRSFNSVTGENLPTTPTPQPTAPNAPAAQPAAPATQPSAPPVSINYHNRIVNYGYGFDSIGAPQDYANDFG